MIENSILKANREGRYALVFALPFPSLQLIELAAHVGFDAVSIDGEHGAYSVEKRRRHLPDVERSRHVRQPRACRTSHHIG